MRRRFRKAVIYAVAVLGLMGGWLVWVVRATDALRPPGPTLGDLLGVLAEPEHSEVFAYKGREYLVVHGPIRLFPRIPSGPPVYVFDDSGQLVGWTLDVWDDTGFLSQWTPKEGSRRATRKEVEDWPRATVSGRIGSFVFGDGRAPLMAGITDDGEPFWMVQEACDSYETHVLPDGRTEIRIVIPPRFADLWLVKLNGLRGTLAEKRSPGGSRPDTQLN